MSDFIGYHVTLRLDDWRVIARTTETRHRLSASIRRISRNTDTFLYGAADNHLHLTPEGDERHAMQVGRRVAIGLQRTLSLPVAFHTRAKPIQNQRHLYNLPHYILSQEPHHGSDADPFHEATCLPDLVGARVGAPWLRRRLLELAPRLDPSSLAEQHLPPMATYEEIGRHGLPLIATAAAAAVCEPSLGGRATPIVAARTEVILIARELDLGTPTQIAAALATSPKTVSRARSRPRDMELRLAILRQLAIRVSHVLGRRAPSAQKRAS